MTTQERFEEYRAENGLRDVGVEFFDEQDSSRVRVPYKTAAPSYRTAYSLMMRVPKAFLAQIGLERPEQPTYRFFCDGYCYLTFPVAIEHQTVTIEQNLRYGTQNTY